MSELSNEFPSSLSSSMSATSPRLFRLPFPHSGHLGAAEAEAETLLIGILQSSRQVSLIEIIQVPCELARILGSGLLAPGVQASMSSFVRSFVRPLLPTRFQALMFISSKSCCWLFGQNWPPLLVSLDSGPYPTHIPSEVALEAHASCRSSVP